MVRMNRKRRAPGTKPKRAARSGLSKVQKKQVKALVAQPAETKYVSLFGYAMNGGGNILGTGVLPNVVSGTAANTAWGLIPFVNQSTVAANGATRVGNKITNVTLRSDFQFWINPLRAGTSTIDYTVKVFIVQAKRIKSNAGIFSLPAGALLDNGDATSIDWNPIGGAADKALATYPLNKEVFTSKMVKSFRLFVNQGQQTADITATVAPNSSSQAQMNFSYTHKHKGALTYVDNNLGTVLPENLSLFCYAVVYDNVALAAAATNTIVLATVRNHMWFKDA